MALTVHGALESKIIAAAASTHPGEWRPAHYAVLACILSHTKRKSLTSNPSQEQIAKSVGLCRTTVWRTLRDLRRWDLISWKSGGLKKRGLKVCNQYFLPLFTVLPGGKLPSRTQVSPLEDLPSVAPAQHAKCSMGATQSSKYKAEDLKKGGMMQTDGGGASEPRPQTTLRILPVEEADRPAVSDSQTAQPHTPSIEGEVIPANLHPLNYARRLLEDLQFPTARENLNAVAAAIECEMKAGKSPPSAYEFVLAGTLDAQGEGYEINRFFFSDQKYRTERRRHARRPTSAAATRSERSIESLRNAFRDPISFSTSPDPGKRQGRG